MKRPAVLLLFALCAVFAVYADTPGFPVQTGHTGAVQTLEYSQGSSLLFSGGDDGTVRGWDPDTGKLTVRLQVSHLPIKMTAVHPSLPLVACLETDGIETFIISLWNYTENRRVAIHRIREVPLFLTYSPSGSYLVYGKTAWDSLVFLDGASGRQTPILEDGFGIVSAVFFSESEKTMLTYGPSGSIQYWDLETGSPKARFATEKDLRNCAFTSNGRRMVAQNGGTIYLIDLLSGKVLSTMKPASGSTVTFDGKRGILHILSADDRQMIHARYNAAGDTLTPVSETSFLFPRGKPVLTPGDDRLFIGTSGGDIYACREGSDHPVRFPVKRMENIEDIAADSAYLAVSGDNRTFLIPTESLSSGVPAGGAYTPLAFSDPVEGSSGICSGNDGNFYLWRKETAGTVYTLSPDEGFIGSVEASQIPVLSCTVTEDGRFLILDRNNTLRLVERETGEELFSYSSFGIRSVVFLPGGVLMAGRNKTSALSAPLLLIHPDTGETVPIEGDAIITMDLRYDPSAKILYSLGMEERSGTMKTVLTSHTGANWESSRALLAFSGEDHSASFAIHEDDSTIFLSLGYGHIRMYRWGGFTTLRGTDHIPRRMETTGNYLFALNTDNTVTVWNYKTGRVIREFYFYEDGSAVAVDGQF